MPLTPGTRLGVYEITAPLGEGGMGQVYRATDTTLGRQVAIKILPDAFSADPDRLARFEREAKTLASLNHPQIAAIYGFEKSPSAGSGQAAVWALVMELVEGDDLSEKLVGLRAQGSGFPIDEALPIAKQIAEALEAAHEQGIVHRDLKPANVKVRADGAVKVLDFGLAKAVGPSKLGPYDPETGGRGLGVGAELAPPDMSPTITTPAMTQAGVILGTAAYMAPEQARGRSVDKRADIWAFGAVLFEMLTTRRAFPGEDITDTIVSIVSKEPDWSALPAATPAGLRRLLARCLKKDPKARMRDIGEARLQLEELISGVQETADAVVAQPAAPAARRLRVVPTLVTAAVASVIVGAGVWTFKPAPAPPRPVTRFAIPLGEGQTFSTNNSQSLALSPDGTALVYVANFQLYLRSMSDREARPIAGTEGRPSPTTPVFAPDGRSIAFFSQQERVFKKVAVSGGAAVTISQSETVRGMSWDASGIIFADASGRIKRVPADGGQAETLLSVKDNEVVYGPALLPGSEWMLFTIAPADNVDTWDKAQIVVQSLKTSERRTLVPGGSDGRYLPTGHIVYALGGVLLAVPFDRQRMMVAGGSVPVVEGVQRGSAGLVARFSVSDTGSLAFVPGPVATSAHTDLALIDRAGASELLKLPPNRYEHPRLSPDGKRIAVGSVDGKDAVVWIYDLSGASSIRRLTLSGRNQVPVWAADGEHVAFQSDRDGDLAIWWQRADGTAPAERLTKPEKDTAHVPESWSPDGRTLLFSVAAGQRFTLAALSLPDRKVTPVGGIQSTIPPAAAFSPDGKWVAYSVNEGTSTITNGLFVQPFPTTGAIHPIAKNGVHPTWAPDGKTLYYLPAPSQIAEVSIATRPAFTFGNPISAPGRFIDRGPRFERSNDITPDGKRFLGLFSAGDDTALGATAPRFIQMVLNWTEELKARVPAK